MMFNLGETVKPVPGLCIILYMFAKKSAFGNWNLQYISEGVNKV